jgi:tetratricopeptide (TPR) repeat protein
MQGRFKEAQQLHKDFHVKIEKLLGVNHDICLRSREVKATFLGQLGFWVEAESIRRQVLQSLLNTLGPRHGRTLGALHNLALVLKLFERYREEVQHLFEITVCFQLEKVTTGDTGRNEQCTIGTIALLADYFNTGGRYDESENLWNCAQKFLGNATRRACSQAFDYHCKRARGYRLQKRFDESDKILRGLFRHHEKSMSPTLKLMVIDELTNVLMETSRQREAEVWLKKAYFLLVEVYGPANHYTMLCCVRVGNCLGEQRRHGETRLFFGDVLKLLASSDDEQMESRVKLIQEVNGWMLKAEKMMMEDSMKMFSRSDDSEGEWLDTDDDDEDDEDEDDEDEDDEDMDDSFGPLCDP